MPEGALFGRRVLELADEKGVYCGKLLADMGAEVIKLERPGGDATRRIPPFWGGDPERSLFFLYTNTGKKSVSLDLETSQGRALFRRLAAGADLVIETLPPGRLEALGLGYAALARSHPALVLTSISGFGQSGPRRDWRASDLVVNALGGALALTGDPEDPPVRLAGRQAWVSASVCAAASSLIALRHSARSGRGQHVDVSAQEVVASVSHVCGAGRFLEDGIVPRRSGSALSASVPSGAYPCRDGRVYLMVNRPAHWKALARWVHETTGNREILAPQFEGPSSNRMEYRELLDLFICEHTSRLCVAELYAEGQARHIAFAPVHTAEGVTRDRQLAARGYFVDVEHPGVGRLRMPGAPFRPAATPWAIRGPAPQPVALAGLRLVEFGAGMAVPWIGRFAAWCGAEVIKVESKRHPDVTRLYVPPGDPGAGVHPQLSPWFTDWNAGKRFVSLDLTRPEAVELVLGLASRADAVIENYSCGVLEKLGLGPAVLRRGNPRLVTLSATGYGGSGPQRGYVSWGPNIEALSGLSRLSGFPGRDCTMTQYAYPDALSALHGLFALLCALEHRDRTGEGQHIDLSQLETTVAALGPLVMEVFAGGRAPEPPGNRSLRAAPHGCYPCAGDDRWCAISVESEAQWGRLCDAAGRPEWRADPRFASREARLTHADALDRAVAEWTAPLCDTELQERLQAAGVAAGAVQSIDDLVLRDPQLAARGYFEEIPHEVRGRVSANGIPLGLTGTPGHTPRAGEALGRDNESVFVDLLGLSPARLRELQARGVVESQD